MKKAEQNKGKKKQNANNRLVVILLIVCLAVTGAFVFNIVRILVADSGSGSTVDTDQNESNSAYTIGNNPTDVNKEYFKELTDAVNGLKDDDDDTHVTLATALVKTFITEYYTWTNKDGNYDIGGMQYMFKPKQTDFEDYTLDNFYADMDLYISQYGRAKLMQVKEVAVDSAQKAADYTVALPADTSEVTDDSAVQTETLPCVEVSATWTYEDNSSIDTAQFQNHAVFEVVNDSGRWEIGAITNTTSSANTTEAN